MKTRSRLVRAAATALAAGLMLTGTVLGGSTPATAKSGDYILSRVEDPDGRPHVLRWNVCQDRITYRINTHILNGFYPNRVKKILIQQIHDAMKQVEWVTKIPFEYKGKTKFMPSDGNWMNKMPSDTEIVIAYLHPLYPQLTTDWWAADFTNAWAAALTNPVSFKVTDEDPWQVASNRGFVLIDPQTIRGLPFGFGPAGSDGTQGAILLHELGHIMGLDHLDAPGEIMGGIQGGPPGTLSVYQAGDLEGLTQLGRRGVTCPMVTDPNNELNDVS